MTIKTYSIFTNNDNCAIDKLLLYDTNLIEERIKYEKETDDADDRGCIGS